MNKEVESVTVSEKKSPRPENFTDGLYQTIKVKKKSSIILKTKRSLVFIR